MMIKALEKRDSNPSATRRQACPDPRLGRRSIAELTAHEHQTSHDGTINTLINVSRTIDWGCLLSAVT